MAHRQQRQFFLRTRKKFSQYFKNSMVLDVGSLDINGNNTYLFDNSCYIGIDVAGGRNVDIVSKGHELKFPDSAFDVIVSSEVFEHDQYYALTLKNMYRMLKPGGLLIFTCATTGRKEHGTRRTTPEDAPLLQDDLEWSDYYKNLEEADIKEVFNLNEDFSLFEFDTNKESQDLYFYGFKVGQKYFKDDYSFLVNSCVIGNLSEKLKKTIIRFFILARWDFKDYRKKLRNKIKGKVKELL